MSIPYGYCIAANGHMAVDQEKAMIVKMIYQQYLSGQSLGGIADFLFEREVPSPRGRERWTQAVISDLLSNPKYIEHIIGADTFFFVQAEKGRRSNFDEVTNKRKATRYSSQSVLSGLLVCGECGCNYRRITRPSGEVVWRCANRVEHGKKFCKHSPSISEEAVKEILCRELDMEAFDETKVKEMLDVVRIQPDGTLHIEGKTPESLEIMMK